MKTKRRMSGYILRSGLAALFVAFVIVALSSAINLPNDHPTFQTQQNDIAFGVNGHESAGSLAASAIQKNRTLTFSDRVAYQRAIEEIYWQHRIWPKDNTSPKPPLDKVMTQAEIEKKVEDYLRDSQALEDYWQRPITPDQLQAEMERIASHTRQPEVLHEIFAALGNDPFVIAECLARPVLAERLVTELYAHDERFHGELKRRAEAELRTHRSVSQMKQTSGTYTEMEWIKSVDADTSSAPDTKNIDAVKMDDTKWQESVARLASQFDSAKAGRARPPGAPGKPTTPRHNEATRANQRATDALAQIKTAVLSALQEDEGYYYSVAVMKKGKDRLKLATIAWLKEPLRSWLAKAETQVPVTMATVSANYTLPVISGPSVACTEGIWTTTNTINGPTDRVYHTAVWTGSEMIVWGGHGSAGYLKTGGKYIPAADHWTPTNIAGAPDGREAHTAVWTGTKMIVWGGYFYGDFTGDHYLNTGGQYSPSADSWTAADAPVYCSPRAHHTVVWIGDEMIVWGGYEIVQGVTYYFSDGCRYDPQLPGWLLTTLVGAPAGRTDHTAVWAGPQMIVWGGWNGTTLNSGGRYNPFADSWQPTSTAGAPAARYYHTAVWTGSQMIIWGGADNGTYFNTGGKYTPGTDSWTPTSITNAPSARAAHTAVWTGNEMIVWGGYFYDGTDHYLNTGGRYNPGTGTPPPIAPKNSVEPLTEAIWTATSTIGAPAGRDFHTAVWTGSEMIVWGGSNGSSDLYSGGRYCVAPPTPTPTPTPRSTATPTPTPTPTATVTPTPAVTTNPATNVASFSATLNGSLNPRGSTTTVYFQYGLTTRYGSNTPMQTQTGNTKRFISANISGLTASTTYHFRIVAHNAGGTAYGNDRTFTTLSPTGPPVVITNPATYIASYSAKLNGSVDPHGLSTTVYFQYGMTTTYGLTTATQSKSGNTYQNVAANITGLSASTTYHFRIVATNSAGTVYGSDRTFTTLSATGPPVAITNPATNVTSSSATLNGSVDPHGLTTTVYFQYGRTTGYGSTTPNQTKTGNAYQNVAANISGLTASTIYHFRIVATNSAGTRYGGDRTFTTP